MICVKSWTIIFHIVYSFFKEYTFIRPVITNPFNSEIYLFLDKYEYKPDLDSVFNNILKNLYRQNVYQMYYLNIDNCFENNPIVQKYNIEVKSWLHELSIVLKNDTSQISHDYITEWHKSNDLLQIQDLTKEFNYQSMQHVLKTTSKKLILKPVMPSILYDKIFYKKLIEKRAELNYYKRIMDTKSSEIFSRKRYGNKNRLFINMGTNI